MRKLLLAALCYLVFTPALVNGLSAQALTADQIVEKHLAAIGGREALGKITSRRATGTISVDTPMGALGGPIEMLAKAPNKARMDLRIDTTAVGGPGEMIMAEIFDGTNGWSVNSMQGDTDMSGDQLAAARNDFFPSQLLKYKELGLTPTVEATQQVNGKPALVVVFTPKTGPAERMFFDSESFLIVRTSSTVNHPQMGSMEQVTDLSDYRTQDGIKVPFVIAQAAGGQNVKFTLTKVEHNVAIDDARFKK